MAEHTDERTAFFRSIPVETIRKAFEKHERELDSRRGYNDSRLPPFDLNWNNTLYSAPWVREKFSNYAAGYYDASWDARQASEALIVASHDQTSTGDAS